MTPSPASVPFPAVEVRLRSLLSDLLFDKAALFDALNALALLDANRCETTLTELALSWRRAAFSLSPSLPDGSPGAVPSGGVAEPEGVAPAPLSGAVPSAPSFPSASGRTPLRAFAERYAAHFPPERACSRALARSLGRLLCRALGGDLPVGSLRREDAEEILSRYRSARSYNGMADRLRSALRWGERNGFGRWPWVDALARRPVPYREPAFFLPDRVERVFRAAEAHPGPPAAAVGVILALGFFAGVRTVEIARARWEDLDLDGAVLRIPRPKGWTNGARPRLVELEPNAVAWLALCRDRLARRRGGRPPTGPMVPRPRLFSAWKKRWLSPVGDSWGRDGTANIMRHTYATMHVAAFRDAPSTALNLGHSRSSTLLDEHYRGLVSRKTALRHWRILPSPHAHDPRPLPHAPLPHPPS